MISIVIKTYHVEVCYWNRSGSKINIDLPNNQFVALNYVNKLSDTLIDRVPKMVFHIFRTQTTSMWNMLIWTIITYREILHKLIWKKWIFNKTENDQRHFNHKITCRRITLLRLGADPNNSNEHRWISLLRLKK